MHLRLAGHVCPVVSKLFNNAVFTLSSPSLLHETPSMWIVAHAAAEDATALGFLAPMFVALASPLFLHEKLSL